MIFDTGRLIVHDQYTPGNIRKIFRHLKLSFIFTYLLIIWLPAHADVVPIVSNISKPWSFKQNGEFTGINADIVIQTIRRMGHEPDIVFVPWKRALLEIRQANSLGIVLVMKTMDREKYMHFSNPISSVANRLFKRKGHSIVWGSDTDLREYSIAAINGYAYNPSFMKLLGTKGAFEKVLTISGIARDLRGLQMLALGRVDLMICASETCEYILNLNKDLARQVEPFPRIIGSPRGLLFGISKAWPNSLEFLQQFNSALEKLRREGFVDAVNAKYLGRELDAILDADQQRAKIYY